MNALIQKLNAFWASLPHAVQALVVLFVTTAGTTIARAPKPCVASA